MQVDCIGGRRTPQGEALSGSSGSGVLLFDVMKLQKTKHGIAVKCERPRQSRHRRHKCKVALFHFHFYKLFVGQVCPTDKSVIDNKKDIPLLFNIQNIKIYNKNSFGYSTVALRFVELPLRLIAIKNSSGIVKGDLIPKFFAGR